MTDDFQSRFETFMTGRGFDACLTGLTLVEADPAVVRTRLTVGPAQENASGLLHGGAIATLVDVVGSFAIAAADAQGRTGVTTDLNVTYLSSVRIGAEVEIRARALRVGRSVATAQVDLLRLPDGAQLAQGRVTKYLGP